MVLKSRGQILLLAVIIFGMLLIDAVAVVRVIKPSVVFLYDYLDDVQLLHIARVVLANYLKTEGSINPADEIQRILDVARNYTWIPEVEVEFSKGKGFYQISFKNKYSSPSLKIVWSFISVSKPFIWREKGGVYRNVTLTFFHEYRGVWGVVRLSPQIRDPQGVAGIWRTGEYMWIVAVPSIPYILEDEYGIRFQVNP